MSVTICYVWNQTINYVFICRGRFRLNFCCIRSGIHQFIKWMEFPNKSRPIFFIPSFLFIQNRKPNMPKLIIQAISSYFRCFVNIHFKVKHDPRVFEELSFKFKGTSAHINWIIRHVQPNLKFKGIKHIKCNDQNILFYFWYEWSLRTCTIQNWISWTDKIVFKLKHQHEPLFLIKGAQRPVIIDLYMGLSKNVYWNSDQ